MNAATIETPPRPWYREPWPWVLIGLPLSAVIGSFVSAYLAVHGADKVIDSDYYRHGLSINAELERAQRAESLGLSARFDAEGLKAGDVVRLQLGAKGALPTDATVRLRLVHPTRPESDRIAVLARLPNAEGARYEGSWQPTEKVASAVAWRIVVEGRDWRMEGDGPEAAGAISGVEVTATPQAATRADKNAAE